MSKKHQLRHKKTHTFFCFKGLSVKYKPIEVKTDREAVSFPSFSCPMVDTRKHYSIENDVEIGLQRRFEKSHWRNSQPILYEFNTPFPHDLVGVENESA